MVESPSSGLPSGAVDDWCVRAFEGAPAVAGRLPPGPGGTFSVFAGRALALRMGALVQQVPPYRALRALQTIAPDGWADTAARRYRSHARLAPPFRDKAADMLPTARGWVDVAPGRSPVHPPAAEPESGPGASVLTELMDRVRRYFAKHAAVGVIGGAETEAGLARVCLMLARFEAGVLPEPGATVEDVHRAVPDDEVREVAGLVRTLRGSPTALPLFKAAGAPSGVAEPVFVRGQAEGDLVVGSTLLAVCLGDHGEVTRRLRHLVAHAWLDRDDLYQIREAGVYSAASGSLASWPVADLAAHLLCGGNPDTARTEFHALTEREITVPRPVASPSAVVRGGSRATAPRSGRAAVTPNRATPLGTVYGPEPWDTVADATWTYWDLWFSVVCITQYGGDWDALDAGLYSTSHLTHGLSEPLWCHLVDLRNRLSAAGLTAADLVGDLAGDRKTVKKARSKILEWTGILAKHFSPAMRDVPSDRFHFRAHFGNWDRYPVSPRPFYGRLAAATPFDLELPGQYLPTFGNIEPLFQALEELEAEHATTPSTLLAVRRAGLTASSLAQHCCDPSYGDLASDASQAIVRFSLTDWRATGIDHAVFWRDALEVFMVFSNFGCAPYGCESEVMENLGADRDRALIKRVVDDLHDSYTADRLEWNAEEVERLSAFV